MTVSATHLTGGMSPTSPMFTAPGLGPGTGGGGGLRPSDGVYG